MIFVTTSKRRRPICIIQTLPLLSTAVHPVAPHMVQQLKGAHIPSPWISVTTRLSIKRQEDQQVGRSDQSVAIGVISATAAT